MLNKNRLYAFSHAAKIINKSGPRTDPWGTFGGKVLTDF